MPYMNIKLDGDRCWPDLADKPDEQILQVQNIDVALLPGGMSSGKASVAIRINLPDGRVVIAQTSQELFDAAARAFRGRLEYLAELAAKGGAES
jgi:uncharacterized protein (UPF0371 family)